MLYNNNKYIYNNICYIIINNSSKENTIYIYVEIIIYIIYTYIITYLLLIILYFNLQFQFKSIDFDITNNYLYKKI